jgi:hypothetical protein
MAKQTYDHVALEDFEIKAQEFISLTFELCEQELRGLRPHRQYHAQDRVPKSNALQFSALSVRNSIKAFLAIVQIKPE